MRLATASALAIALQAFGPSATAASGASVAVALAAQPADSPDLLFQAREPASVQRAVALWKARLDRNPGDAESSWKLARAHYWLGANSGGSRETRRPHLEEGIAVARRAVAIAPRAPDGHFWLAANMGLLAELFGRREGLRYRDDIKRALETTLTADPAYLHGSARRALGRWYATVPGMFGGNKRTGEAYLRASLDLKRDSAITMVLLAELLLDTGRRDEARGQLTAALAAPADPDWTPEDQRFKTRAKELLAGLDARPR
jgi:tetratricopeptide (TPR) repeat protein